MAEYASQPPQITTFAAAGPAPANTSGGTTFCINSDLGFYPSPDWLPCLPGYHHGNWDEVTGDAKKAASSGFNAPGQFAQSVANEASNAAQQALQKANPISGVTDFLNRLWTKISDPAFWKATGLLLLAGVLGVLGVLIWFRKDEAATVKEGAIAA